MDLIHAVAELTWVYSTSENFQAEKGRIVKPAQFHDDPGGESWTVVIPLDVTLRAGDRITVAVAPMVQDAAPALLREGATFDLREGACTIAEGRVIRVRTLEVRDGETLMETLRRAPDQVEIQSVATRDEASRNRRSAPTLYS